MKTIPMIADPDLTPWDRSIDWVKGQPSKTNPVAYANGAGSLTVDATFSSQSIPPESLVEVRFAALGFPGGVIESGWAGLAQTGVNTYSAVGVTALQTFLTNYCTLQPDFIEQMELEWEFRVNGGTEKAVDGVSVNPFYVTRTQPIGGPLYHTVVHTGCKAAKGQTTEDTVFDAIWGEFAGRSIYRVKVVNGVVVDNQLLCYYGRDIESSTNLNTVMDALRIVSVGGSAPYYEEPESASRAREIAKTTGDSVKTLLQYGDSRCGRWAEFAVAVMGAQGIVAVKKGIQTVDPNPNPDPNASLPDFRVPITTPGQGGIPRESIWNDHAVFEYDGIIYDPSHGVDYGTTANALTNFASTLDGIGWHIEPGVRGYGAIFV